MGLNEKATCERYPDLIARDAEIVDMVQHLRVATRRQLQLAHFPCRVPGHYYYCSCDSRRIAPVCRRLRFLRDEAGRLDAYKLEQRQRIFEGLFYTLTEEWERKVLKRESRYKETRRANRAVHRRMQKVRRLIYSDREQLRHHLLINDIYIWFHLSRNACLLSLPDLFIRYLVHDDVRAISRNPEPDGIFTISYSTRLIHHHVTCFIEADCGTERVPVLTEKFEKYRPLLYEIPTHFLLFIGTSDRRIAANVMKPLADLGMAQQAWFTHTGFMKSSNALLDPVWVKYDERNPNKLSQRFGLRDHMDQARR